MVTELSPSRMSPPSTVRLAKFGSLDVISSAFSLPNSRYRWAV